MRNLFLVAYDVADDRRRARAHQLLKGFGDPLQYSLFRCPLSPMAKLDLRAQLWELLDLAEDRVLIVDIGPVSGRGEAALETWGKPLGDGCLPDGPRIF